MHKGALPGLRQFLATENPLKLISLFFTLKTLFVLNIFKFLSWLFGLAEKKFDFKDKINFKIYDVTTLETNKLHDTYFLISQDNRTIKFGS